MEYLTYPFHNPPSDVAPTSTLVAEPEEELDLNSIAGTSASSFASGTSGWTITNSLRSRTDSELSRTSSQLISENNAAFSKLRNIGAQAPDIPEEWRGYVPPSVSKGDWRTFGPVELKVYSLSLPEGTKQKSYKSMLKTARSSTCTGTVWLTNDKLLFALAEGSTAVHNDADEEKKHGLVSSWLGKRKSETERTGPADEEIPITDFETGYPVTGFQLPISTLSKVDSRRKSSSHKRNDSSSRSMSRTLSRTSTRSASIGTPTLSRSQSRTSNGGAQGPESTTLFDLDDRKEKPTVVVVEARPERRFIRLEFSFTSILYKEEAKELVARLETRLR